MPSDGVYITPLLSTASGLKPFVVSSRQPFMHKEWRAMDCAGVRYSTVAMSCIFRFTALVASVSTPSTYIFTSDLPLSVDARVG